VSKSYSPHQSLIHAEFSAGKLAVKYGIDHVTYLPGQFIIAWCFFLRFHDHSAFNKVALAKQKNARQFHRLLCVHYNYI